MINVNWFGGWVPQTPAPAPAAATQEPVQAPTVNKCLYCSTRSATGGWCNCITTLPCDYPECWTIPGMMYKGMPGEVHTLIPVPRFT